MKKQQSLSLADRPALGMMSVLQKYGEVGQTPRRIIFNGRNTARNAIARMLIDDLDSERNSRNNLLNSGITQIGIAVDSST